MRVIGRRGLTIALCAIGLIGCGERQPSRHVSRSREDQSPREITSEYGDRIERESTALLSQIWWPACEVPPRRGRGCGLLTERLTDEWVARFVREVCEQDPDQDLTEECRAALHRKVVDSLRRRYTHANERDVHNACTSQPAKCERFDGLEMFFLMSHNAWLFSEEERMTNALVAEHGEAQESASRARAARRAELEDQRRALAAIGYALEAAGSAMQAQAGSRATSGPVTGSTGGCTTDTQCSLGLMCSKPAGRSVGVCAQLVDRAGLPVIGPGAPDQHIGPGKRQCLTGFECAVGFRCEEGRCLK